jgi:lauroyl/myristoyl acyltransferase
MLPYHLYRAGSGLVRVLPRRASFVLADRVADLLLATAPRKFDPLRANLRHVLPDASPAQLKRVVRANVRQLSRSWVDVMAIPLGVVEVAMRSGAAIVPIVLPRMSWGAEGRVFPEIQYDADAPREAEAERIARKILGIFEGVIRARPEQWHVLDPVWPEDAR